ncbi:MAG: ABC transporter ATP-binding protein [Clostridiales bacterium]|nr:ABC transporter ATP-binding protein [Clostridiales bacterium]
MIEVKHLSKQYGSQMAVSDLSFTITPGGIYGFLGPNGAGKSTTMNIITGCLAATSGEVKIGGYDIFEQPKEAKSQIGYLPELPPLYMDQTVSEYLYFVARAKGIKKSEVQSELHTVIAETRIADVSEKMIKHLSKGYRQRVGIAQALLGNPEIIILDEPTVGLDPAQIIEIRDLIKNLGKKHTVILSSHILSEVQAICDNVLIIHKGKLVAFDKLENLSRTLSSGNVVEICCEATQGKMRSLLAEVPGIHSVKVQKKTKDICDAQLFVGENEPAEICREIFKVFAADGTVLQKLNPVTATLEDIFMRITSESEEEKVPEEAPRKKRFGFMKEAEDDMEEEESENSDQKLSESADESEPDQENAGLSDAQELVQEADPAQQEYVISDAQEDDIKNQTETKETETE